jgi:hypothetical protein
VSTPRPSHHLPPSRACGGLGAVAPRVGLAAVAARAGLGATAARVRLTRVAAGSLLIIAATILAAAVTPSAAAAGRWQRPVTGPVTRPFDYGDDPFAAGRHRGVDFAVRPGDPVRSPCAGRVVFAGTAGASGPTVSVRCGPWRVAYLPLRTLAVRGGARVARGAPLGTAAGHGARLGTTGGHGALLGTAGGPGARLATAAGHGVRLGTPAGSGPHVGLHVGVRREGGRWAYVDPLAFFGARGPIPVPIGPSPRAIRTPPRPRIPRVPITAPEGDPVRVPVVAPSGPAVAIPRGRTVPSSVSSSQAGGPGGAGAAGPVAPWPAWAGLALVLAAAWGAGLSRRRSGVDPVHVGIGPDRRRRVDVTGRHTWLEPARPARDGRVAPRR